MARRLLTLASLLALVTAGCSNPFASKVDEGRVLIIGDSVTALSSKDLRHTFSWATPLDIRAKPGYRTDQLVPAARAGLKHHPQYGVFLPGYNDVLQKVVETTALPDMVDLAAKIPCSVWFTLPADGGYSTDLADVWNRRVHQLTAPHDSIHVVDDWAKLVDKSPDFTFVTERDAVHPNDAGARALAQAMAHALERECGANS